jgi:hypothetical protein
MLDPISRQVVRIDSIGREIARIDSREFAAPKATPDSAGHYRLDQFDGRGNLMRSAHLVDRERTGLRVMGVVPASSPVEL